MEFHHWQAYESLNRRAELRPRQITADTLHRHYNALHDADRKFADDLITHLANKSAKGGPAKK